MAGQSQIISLIGSGKIKMEKQKLLKIIALILGKLVRMASLLFAICLISFFLIKNSPIDPVQAYVSGDMLSVGPEQKQKIAEYWGLNQPARIQFVNWAKALLKGDLGISMIYRRPVFEIIRERFFNSIILMLSAWILSGALGFILGSLAALKKDSWFDRIVKWYCYTLVSVPTFWLGLLLMMVFPVWLGWFPIGLSVPPGILAGEVTLINRLSHLVLPTVTLSLAGLANVALHTRQKLIEVLASEHILFARARGIEGFPLFWQYALRNIAVPGITIQFAAFSELFGGVILAEQVFSYPGLGQATVQAGLSGDTALLLGLVIFSTFFVFTGNLIADLLYYILDPRTRESGVI